MPSLIARADRFALHEPFKISNHVWHAVEVLTVILEDGGFKGWGEGAPIVYHGESAESLCAEVDSMRAAIEGGLSRVALQEAMAPGGARCAIDCALWHLEARRAGKPVHMLAGLPEPAPLVSAITISLNTPEKMGADAQGYSAYPLIKVKLGGPDDETCLRAVRAGAPNSRLTVDANTGWDIAKLKALEPLLIECGVILIEQPLPRDQDDDLKGFASRIPLCADESCQTAADVPGLVGKYQVGSIKLDKTGGLTGALEAKRALEAAGLKLMVSCMVGTSLGMAPARLIAPACFVVDLDGPMNAAEDRVPPIVYTNGMMGVTPAELWG